MNLDNRQFFEVPRGGLDNLLRMIAGLYDPYFDDKYIDDNVYPPIRKYNKPINKMPEQRVHKDEDVGPEASARTVGNCLGQYDVHYDSTGDVPKYIVDIFHAPFKKSDINLAIQDGAIVVEFNKQVSPTIDEKVETRRKGIWESESFTMRLPIETLVNGETIDEQAITAKCEDGILHISLPVKKNAPPKTFTIKLG